MADPRLTRKRWLWIIAGLVVAIVLIIAMWSNMPDAPVRGPAIVIPPAGVVDDIDEPATPPTEPTRTPGYR